MCRSLDQSPVVVIDHSSPTLPPPPPLLLSPSSLSQHDSPHPLLGSVVTAKMAFISPPAATAAQKLAQEAAQEAAHEAAHEAAAGPLLRSVADESGGEIKRQHSFLRLADHFDNQEAIAFDKLSAEEAAKDLLYRQLNTALKHQVYVKKRGKTSFVIFLKMRHEGFDIAARIVKSLYMLIVPRRPFEAYDILKYYQSIPTTEEYAVGNGDINGYVHLYGRLCDALRHIGYRDKTDGFAIANSVATALQGLDRNGRRICFPTFCSAMIEQRWVYVGSYFAGPFYNAIIEQNLTVNPKWWYHILTHSKRNRQEDVPYGDVARRLVTTYGIRPAPNVILHALENVYPFTDLAAVEAFLQSILQLQQESNDLVDEDHPDVFHYGMDISILEAITSVAANQGDAEICVLVLNLLEAYGIDSNESIFENTACAFASSPFTYKQAFTILSEMEQCGYAPRLSLIRTISTLLRYGRSL
jgi:hypothetical protein